jgi:DNA-binding transcriptional MocR family regulator
LFECCLESGVLYVPGVYAYAAEPRQAPTCCARLAYGLPSADQIREGIRRLARAISESGCLSSRPAGARTAAAAP